MEKTVRAGRYASPRHLRSYTAVAGSHSPVMGQGPPQAGKSPLRLREEGEGRGVPHFEPIVPVRNHAEKNRLPMEVGQFFGPLEYFICPIVVEFVIEEEDRAVDTGIVEYFIQYFQIKGLIVHVTKIYRVGALDDPSFERSMMRSKRPGGRVASEKPCR